MNYWIISWTETDGNREQDKFGCDAGLHELLRLLLVQGFFKNVERVEIVPQILDKDGRPDPCAGRHTWVNMAGFKHCIRCGRQGDDAPRGCHGR
jgi:hypothetical protein